MQAQVVKALGQGMWQVPRVSGMTHTQHSIQVLKEVCKGWTWISRGGSGSAGLCFGVLVECGGRCEAEAVDESAVHADTRMHVPDRHWVQKIALSGLKEHLSKWVSMNETNVVINQTYVAVPCLTCLNPMLSY